jgi:hypothetical protein
VLKALGALVLAGGSASRARAQWINACLVPPTQSLKLSAYFEKIRHFDVTHPGDVILDRERYALLGRVVRHLDRLQRTLGHGNFQLVALDDALTAARDLSTVGPFPKPELDFLEEIFYANATAYGFLGEKPLDNLTDRIPPHEVVKVPGSGNYLYKGRPLDTYERIKRDIGDDVILTSGVRGVVKQFMLFLRKAYDHHGNLSLASRSLAPPGFSFHGISDFDLGQRGLGSDNFSERFAASPVYAQLTQLDYIDLRYPQDNLLGVRFEPWHIKVNWRG